MAARHFLCCLPLRLGAFLISLIQCVLAALIAAGLWYNLIKYPDNYTGKLKWTIIATGVYYSILALAALGGFIGTLTRSAGLLRQYGFWLGCALGVQIILDALLLWAYFSTSHDDFVSHCINGSTDQNVIDVCNDATKIGKGWVIGAVVVGLLIQAWAAYIVGSYGHKLEHEHAWTSTVPLDTGYKYTVAPGRGSSEALTGAPAYSYPYAEGGHSFGSNGSPYDPPMKHHV